MCIREEEMKEDYCLLAYEITGEKIQCGRDCPIVNNCPRTNLEDAVDRAEERFIRDIVKIMRKRYPKSQ